MDILSHYLSHRSLDRTPGPRLCLSPPLRTGSSRGDRAEAGRPGAGGRDAERRRATREGETEVG